MNNFLKKTPSNKIQIKNINCLIKKLLIIFCVFLLAIFISFISFIKPEQPIKTCNRPCSSIEWPMICRIKLVIEEFTIIMSECDDKCTNKTRSTITAECNSSKCMKIVTLINKQMPSPMIHVCKNDIMLIDVESRVPGRSLALHWHGQLQEETPFMDGVPMITQCPITSYTTFQYKFRAAQSGTHTYYSYDRNDVNNGVFGGFIVKEADNQNMQKHLYDYDLKEHVLIITGWLDQFNNYKLLLNGEDNVGDLIFYLNKENSYRFRLIYNSGAMMRCPITIKVNKHYLILLALDGNNIEPININQITIHHGERADFLLKLKQKYMNENKFLLQITVNCNDINTNITGLIEYNEVNSTNVELLKTNSMKRLPLEKNLIKNAENLPNQMKQITKRIYLKMNENFYRENLTKLFADNLISIKTINNINFVYPTAPLLTQYKINQDFCNENLIPQHCHNLSYCKCVHVERIHLGDVLEIIFINYNLNSAQILHLHGHKFYVIGTKTLLANETSFEYIKSLNEKNELIDTNIENALLKDTIVVEKQSVAVIRFRAKNPGYWIINDLMSSGTWTDGLNYVLQIGQIPDDIILAPSNFPKCNNWIGPEFFLI